MPRFIYVRTPKTASVSTVYLLSKMFHKAVLLDAANMKFENWPPLSILESSDLIIVTEVWARLLRSVYPDLWAQSISFAVVRNPYDKCVSAWKYCASTKGHSLEFNLRTPPLPEINKHDYVHFTRTQSESIAEENELIVTNTMRFENIDSEFKQFFLKHNFPLANRPHVNKTEGRSGSTTLSLENVELINKNYSQDFLLLNYDMHHTEITI